MEWGFDRRFAMAALTVGVVIGLAGIGITILWPDKKILGWSLLWTAGVIFVGWLLFEIFQWFASPLKRAGFSLLAACVVLGLLLYLQSKSTATPTEQGQGATNPKSSPTQSPPAQPSPNSAIKEPPPESKPHHHPEPTSAPAPKPPGPQQPVVLTAEFIDPQSPLIFISNPSDDVVENVNWAMIAFRTSDLCYFSFGTKDVGYIKPHSRSANYRMELETMPKYSEGCDGQLREGDELIGSVSIDCPYCSVQTYIIDFVWKQSGWYFESDVKAGYLLPKDMSKEGRRKYVQLLTSDKFASRRIEVKPQ